MPSLLIKNLPKSMHEQIKKLAQKHHRSMNKEVVVLLEDAISQFYEVKKFRPAFKGSIHLTNEFIDGAKREGRP